MANREQNRRENDALQSAEGDLALGEDERAFGAGGEKETGRIPKKGEESSRDVNRDPTLPENFDPSGRKPE